MTYEKLNEAIIEEIKGEPGEYIAMLSYSYQSEIYGTFDECESAEIFSFDGSTITWFNDWYEGQDYCYCSKIISIETLLKAYRGVEKIKGLSGWPEDCWEETIKILMI